MLIILLRKYFYFLMIIKNIIYDKVSLKEGFYMSKNSTKMSENLKMEIARELGVYDQVKKDDGWQNVSSKTCGNIVTKAIEIANRAVE